MNNKFHNDPKINQALKIFVTSLTKDFTKVRNKVKLAVDASPKSVKFEDAVKQVRKY